MEANALGTVLEKWRLVNGWSPLPESDHMAMVAAWFEVLNASRVPFSAYNACYLEAMKRRAELKAEGRDPQPLSADDLIVSWRSLKNTFESNEVNGRKLLPENAAASCQRCFGTGREQMPDGSTKDDCAHKPLTEGEISERAQAKAKAIKFIREATARISIKPVETKPEPKPHFQRMQCSTCGRKVNNLEGWTIGETCGRLTNETPCPGVMRVSDEAISTRGL